MAYELKADPSLDVPITMTTAALVVGSELGKRDIAPDHCLWCASNAFDDGARDLLKWDSPKTAATISDACGFMLAPATSFATLAGAAAHDGASRHTPEDLLIVVESVAVTAMVNQIVKFGVARERPYAFHESSHLDKTTPDAHLSFYSGHTSITMALAAAGGTVAYQRDYRLAPLVWIPSAAISLFTGYLRIAADKHYLTDVLTGAVAGSAIGILVPLAFHGRTHETASSSPAPPTAVQAFTIGAAF